MVTRKPPKCYECVKVHEKSLKGMKVTDKASCEKYPNGIPDSVFFDGKACPFLVLSDNAKKEQQRLAGIKIDENSE